jgi:hypothetical protein
MPAQQPQSTGSNINGIPMVNNAKGLGNIQASSGSGTQTPTNVLDVQNPLQQALNNYTGCQSI